MFSYICLRWWIQNTHNSSSPLRGISNLMNYLFLDLEVDTTMNSVFDQTNCQIQQYLGKYSQSKDKMINLVQQLSSLSQGIFENCSLSEMISFMILAVTIITLISPSHHWRCSISAFTRVANASKPEIATLIETKEQSKHFRLRYVPISRR